MHYEFDKPQKPTTIVNRMLGRNLRKVRCVNGVAASTLAAWLCISEDRLNTYENGTAFIPAEALFFAAQYLQCDIALFFSGLWQPG